MRSQQEIVARIKERQDDDFLGFETGDYFCRLEVKNAKPFCKDDADMSDWEQSPADRESILAEMKDYLEFAWGKDNDERGISACRSISHYIAWSWLAGDTEFSAELDRMYENNYTHYGKPILVHIAKHYGWDWRQLDNDRWANYEGGPYQTADQVLA